MAKTKEKQPKQKLPAKKIKKRDQVSKGPHGGVQVVLIEDVLHVGKQGQVVEVKSGYARNFLIPNGMAILPSEHNLHLLDRYKIRVQQLREARIADLKALAEQIARTKSVNIEANSNEEGHLYGSVTSTEICRAMRGKNLLVEPEMIKLDEPIKHCGIFPDIRVSLGYDIESKIEVVVIPQAASGKK
jgi:large subunit ribosomal protein L9